MEPRKQGSSIGDQHSAQFFTGMGAYAMESKSSSVSRRGRPTMIHLELADFTKGSTTRTLARAVFGGPAASYRSNLSPEEMDFV